MYHHLGDFVRKSHLNIVLFISINYVLAQKRLYLFLWLLHFKDCSCICMYVQVVLLNCLSDFLPSNALFYCCIKFLPSKSLF